MQFETEVEPLRVEIASDHRRLLLQLAAGSVRATASGHNFPLPEDLPSAILHHAATFVTIKRDQQLRGCIGSLEPRLPLAEDVRRNARRASRSDPRFPPLATAELAGLTVSVSVLGPTRAFAPSSQHELLTELGRLRPGLILEFGPKRATFLPAVWEQVPEPHEFLSLLKRKAGLPVDFWSPELSFQLYGTLQFERNIVGDDFLGMKS
ncbi:MAG: AmmeMemoRadiSam system protein A [Spirochaetales bacterium]|nr:AmmeMemoRadiSam system protein A [Leptospiraceae bacterium]MCP5480210.1 AmmeMemoRadiSam system protein A [Spirochaetales bacterium]MCP5486391.1 AmmeMemoRadiSam system protein A [Spirochaetales bacterium]